MISSLLLKFSAKTRTFCDINTLYFLLNKWFATQYPIRHLFISFHLIFPFFLSDIITPIDFLHIIYMVYQEWSFIFVKAVENSKRTQFRIGKYGSKRMHEIVEGAVYSQFLAHVQSPLTIPVSRPSVRWLCRSEVGC